MTTLTKEQRTAERQIGKQKRCTKCGEYWPADTEFFYRGNGKDGLHTWCKACVNDETYRRRMADKVSPRPPSKKRKERNGIKNRIEWNKVTSKVI